MAEEFYCPYCNKPCSSKSGLTNHAKSCAANVSEKKMPTTSSDPRDIDPRGFVAQTPRRLPNSEQTAVRPPKSEPAKAPVMPFQMNSAFFIFEHLPILLDLNFAAALADHILTNGSENRAILAFGHQLAKMAGED